jgi:F-type H+-transporting ATPase subunit gamma
MKDTKRRIVSVKSTQKITRAMKLVSAAKYARANQAAVNARPYGKAFENIVSRLSNIDVQDRVPLVKVREEKSAVLVIIASDRGLCGALNSNLLKKCQEFLDKKKAAGANIELVLWGKRAVLFGAKRRERVIEKRERVIEKPNYTLALQKANEFSALFTDKKIDRLYVAYPKFVSAMSQESTIDCILPVGIEAKEKSIDSVDFIFEPSKVQLLNSLLVKQIANRMFRFFLDASASEHAARMTAMDSATNNASEVIKKLTLDYNRARQAAITKELIEITSGADAL